MRRSTTEIIEDAIQNDVWNEILAADALTELVDLSKLATDYSCQGCAY